MARRGSMVPAAPVRDLWH